MSLAHDVLRRQQDNNYISDKRAVLYIELTKNHDGTPKLEIYLIDGEQKILVNTNKFVISADGKQSFILSDFADLKLEYNSVSNSFSISGDSVTHPLYIHSEYDLDLQHVYSLHDMQVISTKSTFIGDLRVGALEKRADINITSNTCLVHSNLNINGELHINADNFDVPENVTIMSACDGTFKISKNANLQGVITSKKQLELRAAGGLVYDVSRLHGEEVILQVSKVAHMQFPNNIKIENPINQNKAIDFSHTRAASPINYELIAHDNNPIHILNNAFFPILKINAPNNNIIVGSDDQKATLLGDKIFINAKHVKIHH